MHPAGKQPQGRGKERGGGFPQAKPTPGGRGWEQMLLGSKVLCGHRGFTAGVEAAVLGPACCRNGHKDGVKRTWEQWPPWLGRGAVGFIFSSFFFLIPLEFLLPPNDEIRTGSPSHRAPGMAPNLCKTSEEEGKEQKCGW